MVKPDKSELVHDQTAEATCQTVSGQLEAFLRALVTENQAVTIELHLEQCRACREELVAIAASSPSKTGLKALLSGFEARPDAPAFSDLAARDTSQRSHESRVGSSDATARGTASETPVEVLPVWPKSLLERFELRGRLGAGGMGVVYRAFDRLNGRVVAIKTLRGEVPSLEERIRILAEARAMAQVSHPAIVQVYETILEEDRVYVVMELIEGLPLNRWLNRTQLDWKLAARLTQQIAEGVEQIHRSGLVHRDLKPANILLERSVAPLEKNPASEMELVPKLTDFGIARDLVQSGFTVTQAGQVLGTPAYMAPEQARAEARAATAAADIYSLGAILYELLTGRPPFVGQDPLLMMRLISDSNPVAPRLLCPVLPRDLETICLKCLEKYPGARYGSAAELSEELKAFQGNRPIRARPAGPALRAWRWCQRNPAWALSLAFLLLSVLLLGIGGYVAAGIQRRLATEALEAKSKSEQQAEAGREAWLSSFRRIQTLYSELQTAYQAGRPVSEVLQSPDQMLKLLTGLQQDFLTQAGPAEEWTSMEVQAALNVLHGKLQLGFEPLESPESVQLMSGLEGALSRLLEAAPHDQQLCQNRLAANALRIDAARRSGDLRRAVSVFEQSAALAACMAQENATDSELFAQAGRIHFDLATSLWDLGERVGYQRAAEESLQHFRTACRLSPAQSTRKRDLVYAYYQVASRLQEKQLNAEAAEMARAGLQVLEEAVWEELLEAQWHEFQRGLSGLLRSHSEGE